MLISKQAGELRMGEEFLILDPPACHLCKRIDGVVTLTGDMTVIDMVVPAHYLVIHTSRQVWVPTNAEAPLSELLELE